MVKRPQPKRSQVPLKRSPVKKRRAGARRGPMRDRLYLAWLRQLPCMVCGDMWQTREAAHGPVNGMSQKGPDDEAVPLCAHHHREMHVRGWPAFEAGHCFSRAELAKRLYAEYLATK